MGLSTNAAFLSVTLSAAALLGACSSSSPTPPPRGPGGVGDDCSDTQPCRDPLVCRLGKCEIEQTQGEGDPCTYTAQCMAGLYCAEDGRCAPAGGGGVGSPCGSTADCDVSLVCAPGPGGDVCSSSGTIDVGGGCVRVDQCLAGLSCVGIQCTGHGGTGTDAGMDAGRDGGGGRDSGRDTGIPDGGGVDVVIPDGSFADAGIGCDLAHCSSPDPCLIPACDGTRCAPKMIDFDGDGYASNMFDRSCGDCADSEGDAHPGQTRYFTSAHREGAADPMNFDWNCDGMEEKQYTNAVTCDGGSGCIVSEGWRGGVPDCGATGTWVSCTGLCNIAVLEPNRIQPCR